MTSLTGQPVRRAEGGFVLATTLIVLAIVAVVAAYFHERVQDALRIAQLRNEAVDAELGLSDAQAELLFTLGTTPMSLDGLGAGDGAVKLDGTPYRAPLDTRIALQDTRGLFNLNIFTDLRLERFLTLLQVPVEDHPALRDALRDYTDRDHDRHLLGAERHEYEAVGLLAPRNNTLRTPLEVKQVLTWREREDVWGKSGFEDSVTVAKNNGWNPSTAPRLVLQTIPGIDAEGADRLIELRKARRIDETALRDVGGSILNFSGGEIVLMPSETIRVTQWSPRLPWRLRYSVTLTPLDPLAPWRIDYQYKVPAAVSEPHVDEKSFSQFPVGAPATTPAAPPASAVGS